MWTSAFTCFACTLDEPAYAKLRNRHRRLPCCQRRAKNRSQSLPAADALPVALSIYIQSAPIPTQPNLALLLPIRCRFQLPYHTASATSPRSLSGSRYPRSQLPSCSQLPQAAMKRRHVDRRCGPGPPRCTSDGALQCLLSPQSPNCVDVDVCSVVSMPVVRRGVLGEIDT